MSVFCIISEFNPMHNGHKYLIDQAKERGAEATVCIMSGNATQRGELAVIEKYRRAEAAIGCGVDLVLELPFPWCAASAEYFATAGVHIAKNFGDTLFFGSESGSSEKLKLAAEYCETEEFCDKYRQLTSEGIGAAKAFEECLSAGGVKDTYSNDILGIAYIRAINRLSADMLTDTIKREGGAYNEENTVEGAFQSATAMRKYINEGNIGGMAEYVPAPMLRIIEEEYKNGTVTDIEYIASLVLGYYRLVSTEELDVISDMTGGLSSRFCTAAKHSVTVGEMMDRLRTKRYTDAKLRRALLFGLTGVTAETVWGLPEYTRLLAANQKGRELLAKNRKSGGITVVTKPADAPKCGVQFELERRLEAIYCMARKKTCSADSFLKKKAYIDFVEK